MFGVVARRATSSAARPTLRSCRWLSSEAAPTTMKFNFCLPHETIYKDKDVEQVIIPGSAGEYGVTVGHSPIVSELKPGVLQVLHGEGQAPEKFFVSAGFALTHDDSVTDVTAIEAVRVEELDEAAVQEAYSTAKSEVDGSVAGSREWAEATVGLETCKAMGAAIGLSLA